MLRWQVFPFICGMENIEEKACLCALNRIFGFEPKIGLTLISHFGSALEVIRLGEDKIDKVIGPYSKYKGRITPQAVKDAASELETLAHRGISFHGITEASYPPLLRECEDAPIGLYVRSTTPAEELWKRSAVSIVGTRDISPYGKEWCRKIVNGLSTTTHKPVIVSGLALGVDIEAHRSAIDYGLPTIAVMATGPDSIYPYRHRAFADTLASTNGCALVTDYPPGTAPLPVHFLRRNRIIAGLSGATVLVESKSKGGGLMTCRLAFSYNRDVYALPGRIDDTRSQGCNELIRQKIAEPISSVPALIESLGMTAAATGSQLNDRERLTIHYGRHLAAQDIDIMTGMMALLRRKRGMTAEDLALSLKIAYLKASELIAFLEIDGFVTRDLFQRCSINTKNL